MARKRSPEVQRALDEVENDKKAERDKGTAAISKRRLKQLKKGFPLNQGEGPEVEDFNLDTGEYDIFETDIISIAPADKEGLPKNLVGKKPDFREVGFVPKKKKGSRKPIPPGGIKRKTKPKRKDKKREA